MPNDECAARAVDSEADTASPTTALVRFDPDEYRGDLDELDITDEEKDELLRVLWNIMCSFVDLGWDVDAVSLVFQPDANASSPGGERQTTAPSGVGAP